MMSVHFVHVFEPILSCFYFSDFSDKMAEIGIDPPTKLDTELVSYTPFSNMITVRNLSFVLLHVGVNKAFR